MARALALTLACVFAAASAHAADAAKAQGHFDKALNHYREGDFESSLSFLSKALAEDKRALEAYALRALVRERTGDRLGMNADLAQALRIQTSRRPLLLVLRGQARRLSGDLEAARKDFELAVETDKEFADAYFARGALARREGDAKKALAEWVQALKLDPNLYLARHDLAWALYELGYPDRAIKQLTKALRGNPSFHLPYSLLGVIFAEQGDGERALKAYSKALYLRPDFSFAAVGRGLVHLRMGKQALAFKDFDQAVADARGDWTPLFNRGEVHYRLGKGAEALADFKAALALNVDEPNAARVMAGRFADQKLWTEAVAMTTAELAALNASAKPPAGAVERALLARADALAELKLNERALKDLETAVRISSQSARAWTAHGRMLERFGKTREAFEDFNRAIAAEPNFAPALLARGNMRAQNRVYEEALEDISKALESDPLLADAYNNRGVLQATVFEDYDKAVADLEKAVELKADSPGFHLNLGMARLFRRDFWKSVEALNRALELKAPLPRVYHYRSQAYYALGSLSKAESDIREAMKLEPKNGDHPAVLGNFFVRSREYGRAVAALDQAVAVDGKNAQAFLDRGRAHAGLSDYSRASRDFRRAARLTPKPLEALTLLCQAERLRGAISSAISACTEALRIDPDHGPAYLHRGMALLAHKDFPKAVRDLDDGTRLGPKRAEAFLARSLAHIPLKQFRESDEAYREALRLDPGARYADIPMGGELSPKWEYQPNVDAYAQLLEDNAQDPHSYLVRGNALHSSGYYDRAILEYTRAMEIDGNLINAYLARGASLAAQESLDAAEHDLRRAVDLKPDDPNTHLALVTLLTARRRYGEGLKAAIAAMRKQGDNPHAETFVKAGNLRYFLKDTAKAKENFLLALKLDPKNPGAHSGLGLCQFSRREYALALESFSRAIAGDPEYDKFYRNRAATYVNLKDFANAAADYKLALSVNKDPEMVEEYQKLIDSSKKMLPNRQTNTAQKAGEPAGG